MAQDTSQYYTAQTGPNKGTVYGSYDIYKQYNQGQLDPVSSPTSTAPIPAPVTPTNTPVSTAQPNPATVNATPYTSTAFYKPEQAQAGLDPNTVFNDKGEALDYNSYIAQGGKADFSNVQKVSNLQQAFNKANASGLPAPQTPGEAAKAVSSMMPKSGGNAVQNAQSILEQSPEYQTWLKDVEQLNNYQAQTQSLTDFYKQSITDAGIPGINTDLVNLKSVIDGTEDDIRNEVKAASGFATESQVMALSSARNKSLIKRYNLLLDTKNAAMEQINTMIGLAAQDRDYAMQAINQKLNIDAQALEIKAKMISASQEAYARVIDAIGYQGLYESLKNDPSSVSLAERTLGLGAGQLQAIGNLQNLSQYSISSPYVLTDSGEVQDAQTGYGFTSPEDFMEKTGMTLQQAEASGALQPLGLTKAEEEMQFERSLKLADLDLQQQQVDISRRNSDISAGNLSLAREKAAWDQQMDLMSLPQPGQASQETLNKLQSSNEYKIVGATIPAIQSIKTYLDLVNKHGTVSKGTARGELDAAYGNAIIAWKSLAALGALSGADFELADNAIPSATGGFLWGSFKSDAKVKARLEGSLKDAVAKAETYTQRLSQIYPDAGGLLQTQMDDILVKAYPDKYKRGDDGQVYEITD